MFKNPIYLKLVICCLFSITVFSQEETLKTGWKISNKAILRNNQEAIVVVNEKIIHKDILNAIDPKNIESVNVLKGKTASAIYGQNAEKGAILITTKNISKRELNKLYDLYSINITENSQEKAFNISGIVYDCEKIEIPGATISNLNSEKSTTSDFFGKFTLEVRKNDVLKIELNGYKSQRVLIDSKKELTIQLSENPNDGKIMVAKPVIYLYPTEKTEIDLQLNFKGKLLTTFPKYDKNWEVVAEPNGQIFDKKTNRYYSSLFWDGTIDFPEEHYKYDDGFIVPKEKLAEFLIEKLEHIGLNNQETNEFIQYWLPILERNKYNFIHFLVNEECDEIAILNVNPKPETTIRIYMEFYGLENFTEIKEQQLPKTERKGFTLVEWGGADFSGDISEEDFFTINKLPEYITLSHKRKDPKNIQPLYVIDNKISTKKIFDKLYPSEIKKIEILDGMSGAAYYGEEGRNGVFIVITKSSKK